MAEKELNNMDNKNKLEADGVDESASDDKALVQTSGNAVEVSKKSSKSKVKKSQEDEEEKTSFFKKFGNFFARIVKRLKKFWRNTKSELKKVTWFSRKQTYTSSLLVFVVMAVTAVVVGFLDLGFSKGIEGLSDLYYLISRTISK